MRVRERSKGLLSKVVSMLGGNSMGQKFFRNLCIGVASLFASAASAETAICSGLVKTMSNHVPGGVYVRVADFGLFRMRAPGQTTFRTTAENCKHYTTIISLAIALNKPVTVFIDNAPASTSISIANWHDADVRYVELQN
jgi:hypothetical protein